MDKILFLLSKLFNTYLYSYSTDYLEQLNRFKDDFEETKIGVINAFWRQFQNFSGCSFLKIHCFENSLF